MAENKLISVIVPVYNAERYIGKCVDSLLNVPMNKLIEIILIDDGSTDGSGIIADSYADKYNNVKCFHKDNGGLSDARNFGLSKASGKYVFFCDDDDIINADAFESVLKAAKNSDSDILQWDGICIDETDKMITVEYSRRIVHSGLPSDGKPMSGIAMLTTQISNNRDCPFVVWLRAYKRSFLEQNDLFFEKGWLHEDELWSPVVLTKAKSVIYLPVKVYCYRIREHSIMTSFDAKREAHVENLITTMKRQYEYYHAEIEDPRSMTILLAHWARKYMGEITQFKFSECSCSAHIPKWDILISSRGIMDRLRSLYLYVFGVKAYSKLFSVIKGIIR